MPSKSPVVDSATSCLLTRSSSEAFSDGDSDDTDGYSEEGDLDMDEDASAPKPSTPELTPEQLAARQIAMDKLVPRIDPSDYGKMPPSYYSNSQRVASVTIETETREDLSPGASADANHTTHSRPIRAPLLPRDNFDGVDSDDESDEEDPADDEDDEGRPQVVGEIEIDMAEEEDEFIEFARQVLGVDDNQWRDILKDRRDRGGALLHFNCGAFH